MNQLIALVLNSFHAHPLIWGWVAATMIGALPTPSGSNQFYKWVFTVLTTLGAGLARVVATQMPASGLGKKLTRKV